MTKNATYIAVREDGELVKMTEAKFNNDVKKVQDANIEIDKNNLAHPDEEPKVHVALPVAERQQTYVKHTAATIAEAQELVPTESVLLTYFNRGYALAEEKFISDHLTDDTFTATEGVVDLAPELQTLPERTRATRKEQTPEEMVQALKALPPDQLAKYIEEFMAVLGTSVGAK